jgi:hypothetical protein
MVANRRLQRLLARFVLYGMLGLAGEILFYNLTKAGRLVPGIRWLFAYDWRVDDRLALSSVWQVPLASLYGQASAWMFFVYATILVTLERVRDTLARWNRIARAVAYAATILTLECALGWVLRAVTGYDVWYYADSLAILRYTSLAIAPVWFLLGASLEGLCPLVQRAMTLLWPDAERHPALADPGSLGAGDPSPPERP